MFFYYSHVDSSLVFSSRNPLIYSKYEAKRRKKFNEELERLKIALEPDATDCTKVEIVRAAVLFVHRCRTFHGNKFSCKFFKYK